MQSKSISFGDAVQMISGKTPSKQNPDFWNGNVPWISASSMDKLYVSSSVEQITERALKESGIKYIDEGTPLLLVRGSILHQRVPISIPTRKVTINQDVKALKLKTDSIDPDYFLAWLLASEKLLLEKVEFTGIGAGKLDTEVLNKLSIPCFNKDRQSFIGNLSKSINQKIELNTQLNRTLESIVEAIFREWFIDFGPVKAKAEGKKPFGMDNNTASLFPNSFETSEIGQIPKGWRVATIAELTEKIQYGYTTSATKDSTGPKFLRITDIQGGRCNWDTVPHCVAKDEDIQKYLLKDGDVVVARTGASTGENMLILAPPKALFASYLVCFKFKKTAMSRFVASYMRTKNYFDFVSNILGGSAQPNANAQQLASAKFVVATDEIINSFYLQIQPLEKQLRHNQDEHNYLLNMRELLLPKLISGEIDIREVSVD